MARKWLWLAAAILLSIFGEDTRTYSLAASLPSAASSSIEADYNNYQFQRVKRQEDEEAAVDDVEAILGLDGGAEVEEPVEAEEPPVISEDTEIVEEVLEEPAEEGSGLEIIEGSGEDPVEETLEEPTDNIEAILGLDDDISEVGTTVENTAVLEATPVEEPTTAPLPPCAATEYGCCSFNSTVPAHGQREEGCCLLADNGCCPDLITHAAGKDQSGCFCSETDYGCCPDGVTAARGPENLGCGCTYSTYGCCPDQVTVSPGPDQEGCPCHTSEFGCCADGATDAQGPNLEGCPTCSDSEFGCCPDGFTPAAGADGCTCAGSEHGCCPDGETSATGPEFEGCDEIPGEYCHLPKASGSCRQNFTVKWFFDMEYGGCSRFWYSDCGEDNVGNGNRFENELTCMGHCVKPQGSGRCYLPKVSGPCKASLTRFYFDKKWNKCINFTYSGCLGNANNFETIQECQESCLSTPDDVSVCDQRFEPGPCRGHYERWYYDSNDGLCKMMNYTGCKGNANRFMTKEECDNTCKHESKIVRAKIVCSLPKQRGHCRETVAKWYFDNFQKTCLPFYYSGCGGNENNFDSWEECEQACPNTFPPEINLSAKVLVIEEGFPALFDVEITANPAPTINWLKDGEPVNLDDRLSQMENGSLNVVTTEMTDSGTWTIIADNGLGQVVRKQIVLNVHPSRMPIEVVIGKEETLFKQGDDITLTCQVKGYPIPVIKWYKNNLALNKVSRIQVLNDNSLVLTETSTIDGGTYSCRATNEHESVSDRIAIKVEKAEEVKQCVDKPEYASCDLIVKAKYCNKNPYYADFCCASCTAAGQLSGLENAEEDDNEEPSENEQGETDEPSEDETEAEEPLEDETEEPSEDETEAEEPLEVETEEPTEDDTEAEEPSEDETEVEETETADEPSNYDYEDEDAGPEMEYETEGGEATTPEDLPPPEYEAVAEE